MYCAMYPLSLAVICRLILMTANWHSYLFRLDLPKYLSHQSPLNFEVGEFLFLQDAALFRCSDNPTPINSTMKRPRRRHHDVEFSTFESPKMNSCVMPVLLLWITLNSVDGNAGVRSGRTLLVEPITTSLRVVQNLTRPVERIVDVKALDEIGGDALAAEFVNHPPGHEANVNDYPFFAHWSHAMCGASIVHDDVLLTAGHCGRKALDPLWRKQVRLLSKYREQEGIVRHVAHLEIHPKYNQYVQEFDFQLIKVNSSMLVDDNGGSTGAQVIKLNRDPNNPKHGDPVQAVGFGTVTPDGHSGNSKVLMDATLQAFSSDHCLKQYGPGKIVEEIMMCVGSVDGAVDTCQGEYFKSSSECGVQSSRVAKLTGSRTTILLCLALKATVEVPCLTKRMCRSLSCLGVKVR
jgi:Trypsin